jgi:hypothetical protein
MTYFAAWDICIPLGEDAVKDSIVECEKEIPNGVVQHTRVCVQYDILCHSNFVTK